MRLQTDDQNQEYCYSKEVLKKTQQQLLKTIYVSKALQIGSYYNKPCIVKTYNEGTNPCFHEINGNINLLRLKDENQYVTTVYECGEIDRTTSPLTDGHNNYLIIEYGGDKNLDDWTDSFYDEFKTTVDIPRLLSN